MTVTALSALLMRKLPALELCTRLSIGAGDVVIHAPGFEDRTMAVADIVKPKRGAHAILLDYLPFSARNRVGDVRESLRKSRLAIADEDIVTYNRFEPRDFEERLRARLIALAARRVVLDISTMSKLAIMLVLEICRVLDLDVCVFYAEAQEYGPSEAEFEAAKNDNAIHRPSLQVFTGVHGVVRVESLKSVAMQGNPTAALVFMSFNDALTQVLLNTVYPSRLFLINGRPPVHRWRELATAWIHDQVRREWEEDNPVRLDVVGGVQMPTRVVSTLDYRETVVSLLGLYWQLSATHRILLAPAGSKMQAVGCSLVKALHPDIHIEYPSPEGFQAVYSSGIADCWLLDFGRLSEQLAAVSGAERQEYLEIPP